MHTIHRLARTALALLSFALLTAASPGCLSNTPGDPNPDHSIDWPSYVDCGPDVSDLIGVVTRIVMSNDGFAQGKELADNAVAELEALAKEHGGETVACLLDRVIADWSRPGAAASEQIGPALERAKSFMRSEGIEVKRDGYGPEAALDIDIDDLTAQAAVYQYADAWGWRMKLAIAASELPSYGGDACALQWYEPWPTSSLACGVEPTSEPTL